MATSYSSSYDDSGPLFYCYEVTSRTCRGSILVPETSLIISSQTLFAATWGALTYFWIHGWGEFVYLIAIPIAVCVIGPSSEFQCQ